MTIQFKTTIFSTVALCALAVCAIPVSANAQNLPSSAEAARISTDLERESLPQVSGRPDVSSMPVFEAPEGADKIFLVLKDIKVTGANVIAPGALAKYYVDDIDTRISLARIYEIAALMTREYRDQGYLISQVVVPAQNVSDGVVELRVVEGRISTITVQGEPRGGSELLQKYVSNLKAEPALTAESMERYLLLMNDIPGLSVRSILSPSNTEAGAADLTLVVSQDFYEGFASVDNYGSKFIGQERFTVGGQLNGAFGFHEQINATAMHVPDEGGELSYFAGSWSQPVGSDGLNWGFGLSHSVTDPTLPDALGGNLGPEGESTNMYVELTYPILRSRLENFSIGGKIDFAHSKNDFDAAPALETEDRLRVLRLDADYSFLDGWNGFNAINFEISKGFTILGGSKGTDTDTSRSGGEGSFTKFAFEGSRYQRLWGPISLQLGAAGQFSPNTLLAGEEFGLGGSQFGRGYDFSELTGEQGLIGKMDFVFTKSLGYSYLQGYEAYAFYDVGRVWQHDRGAGEEAHESLASTGFGTRLTFTDWLSGEALLAFPLTRDVQSRGRSGDDPRFHFSLTSRF